MSVRKLDVQIEPLLNSKNKRFRLYPILYPKLWEFYKKHQSAFWISEEINFSLDLNDWNNKLNDDERFYIKRVLAFFAASDFIVNENGEKDAEEVQVLEYQFYNADKIAREMVHTETYQNMLEVFVPDDDERTQLYDAVQTIDTVRHKAEWFRKYIENGTFAQRVLACAITEGIFFSSSFCSIFWLKSRGLMPSLCDSNLFIIKDESTHRDVAVYVYKELIVNKLPENEVLQMIKDAVEIEIKFCTEALPVSLIGMNAELMSQYIQYVADHLCVALLGRVIYNVENPLDFMNLISLETKNDFFVFHNVTYARQKALTDKSENVIRFDADY